MSCPETIQDDEDDPEEVEAEGAQCLICLAPLLTQETCVTRCGHVYHSACLFRWTQEKSWCASCREPVKISEFRQLTFETVQVMPRAVRELMRLRSIPVDKRVDLREELLAEVAEAEAESESATKMMEEARAHSQEQKQQRREFQQEAQAHEKETTSILRQLAPLVTKCAEIQATRDSLVTQRSRKFVVRQALDNDPDVKEERKRLKFMDVKERIKMLHSSVVFERRQETEVKALVSDLEKAQKIAEQNLITERETEERHSRELQKRREAVAASRASREASEFKAEASAATSAPASHDPIASRPAKAGPAQLPPRTRPAPPAQAAADAADADEESLLFGAFGNASRKPAKPGGMFGSARAPAKAGGLFGNGHAANGARVGTASSPSGVSRLNTSTLRTRFSERGA